MEDLEEGNEDEIHQFRRVHVVIKRILTAVPMQQPIKDDPLHEYGECTVIDTAVTDKNRLGNDGNIPQFQLSTPQTSQHSELHRSQTQDREQGVIRISETELQRAQIALQQVDNCKWAAVPVL